MAVAPSLGGKMNPNTSKLTKLLGSASLLALANAMGAHAQQTAQAQVAQAQTAQVESEVPETVLIPGSLIRGSVAVGVPVTNLNTQDFVTSGALSASDLFRSIPAANVT